MAALEDINKWTSTFPASEPSSKSFPVQLLPVLTSALRFQTAENHSNVNFRVLDSSYLTSNTDGILGMFLTPGAYQVQKSEIEEDNSGFLLRA